MASHFSLPWIITDTRKTINFPTLVPFSQRTSKRKIYNIPIFKASNEEGEGHNSISKHDIDEYLNKFDRRDVLFGLGGAAASASLGGVGNSFALSNPVITPNINNCGPSTILDPATGVPQEKIFCCPPSPDEIISFVAPPVPEKLRVRPAAHLMTPDQLEKFERAIKKMKELEPSDPRNFYQQANIHCAYCNDGYEQQGYPGIDLKVHGNWLFQPFHRCYLYFYERILGHLIDDPTFALPFWNFDNPDGGMQMPPIYTYSTSSPLYDRLRNQKHLTPFPLDLNYSGDDNVPPDVFDINLRIMHRQMFTNAKTAESFFGLPVQGGETTTKEGSIENTPHNNIHFWSGDPNSKYGEDMGNFYSSGRDIMFYGLHGNVDRLWCLWKKLGKGKHKDFKDNNWLDSSFVFYDEYKNAVRIKVRDCLDTEKLGYVYQEVPIYWQYAPPTPLPPKKLKKIAKKFTATVKKSVKFPLLLDSIITTKVDRPKKSRSRREKDDEDEILVIEGIEFDENLRVHFDVIINVLEDDSDIVDPRNTEFIGSFSSVPHLHKNGKKQKSELNLGITEALEELDCDDNDTLLVTLIPKLGKGKITIGGIKIKFLPLNKD